MKYPQEEEENGFLNTLNKFIDDFYRTNYNRGGMRGIFNFYRKFQEIFVQATNIKKKCHTA